LADFHRQHIKQALGARAYHEETAQRCLADIADIER
jgi:hypothetical protein